MCFNTARNVHIFMLTPKKICSYSEDLGRCIDSSGEGGWEGQSGDLQKKPLRGAELALYSQVMLFHPVGSRQD